jgi:hypothetical protein
MVTGAFTVGLLTFLNAHTNKKSSCLQPTQARQYASSVRTDVTQTKRKASAYLQPTHTGKRFTHIAHAFHRHMKSARVGFKKINNFIKTAEKKGKTGI